MPAPPLPSPIKGFTVTKADGTKAVVVSLRDAAKLLLVKREDIKRWVKQGKVPMCVHPQGETMVFVDSLWDMVPKEFQNG